MRTLCLILLFTGSLQLQCDKTDITAHIESEFVLKCKYDTSRYLYSKKYWCRGDSRTTCEIVVDSETKNTHRSLILDAGRRGLYVKVTKLQLDDAGVYWVGIDKIYADIMTSIKLVITEVPVSKPRLWPLSPLVDRPTCWGKPVTVRCRCEMGTGIRYAWYKQTYHQDFLLHHSSDLSLHCGTVQEDSDYYCNASNDISSKESDMVSVQVLMSADSNCIYVVNIQGQPIYDCADRMRTTTVKPPPRTTCQTTTKIQSDIRNQSLQTNLTVQDLFFCRAWTGMPLWYTLLRLSSFPSLLIFLCLFLTCTKVKHRKHAKRKKRVHFRQMAR